MAKTRKIHEGNSYNRDITAMTMPLFVMSFFFYGPRVMLLAIVAVVTARLADRLAALMRSRKYDGTENSSTPMALIIVLMMPASIRFGIIIAAVLVAVLVAKEAFGGYNSYPFNPSAVGFCAAAVSWPSEVFSYPQPTNWILTGQTDLNVLMDLWTFQGQTLVNGPSQTLKSGGLPNIANPTIFLGNYAAPLGTTAVVVIAACALYLVIKRHMPLAAPLSFLGVTFLISYLLPRGATQVWSTLPWENVLLRLESVKFEHLSGALIFCAVFLVNEPGTLPKNTISRVIYGGLLGFATMMFRYFGIYELGACFAFLLVNAVSGYFDRAVARVSAKRKQVKAG